jgi:hypothetical protein
MTDDISVAANLEIETFEKRSRCHPDGALATEGSGRE